MEVPVILFVIAFVTVLGYFVVRFVKYGGLRFVIRVLALDDGRIVLEQSSRTMLSASMNGISMRADDADRLIRLLQQARATSTGMQPG